MIIIIDYGVGNPNSIKNMLRKCGENQVMISSSIDQIKEAKKLILPGVGHFDYGMKKLAEYNLIEVLNLKALEEKVPVLGICLGAQLLTNRSEEGSSKGLGWINADTQRFNFSQEISKTHKIPHMGWNEVSKAKESKLLENMPLDLRYYFVHSYHIVCSNQEDVLLNSSYGNTFVAAVERENIMGVQFHPEKSHKFGMKLLNNFINNY
jgi:glutamine amidotransferase